MSKFASICILGYKREQMLRDCLASLHETLDYPAEIIVNFDGVDSVSDVMFGLMNKYSKAIVSKGNNRGVGRSFQNCLGVAEGDYIFKVDADIIFKPHWLSTVVNILDNNEDIATVSLFDYRHYDPKDERFNHTEEREDCFVVDDFVSSIYGFRKADLAWSGMSKKAIPDDGLHKSLMGKLAITKEDFIDNQGFGLGKSVYVVADEKGEPVKAVTYSEPLVFHKE